MEKLKIKLIGIPLISVLISFMFFLDKCPLFSLHFLLGFAICFLTTTVIWLGNEAIFDYFHARLPLMEDTFQRVLFIALSSAVYTITGYFSTAYLIKLGLHDFKMPTDYWFELKICLLFTTLVVLFYEASFFFKQWKDTLVEAEKLRKETVQAQLEGLRQQINPHFLFNSLNTLVAIIPENTQTATDFVHKLSHVYRYLLCVKEKELVTLAEELEFLNSYIFLLKVRFEENLNIRLSVPESAKGKLLPPVSLQLLIENAIKHNVVSREHPLHLDIFVEDNRLLVQNNLQPKQQLEESTGMGLQNIQTRYVLLSEEKVGITHTATHFLVSLPLL